MILSAARPAVITVQCTTCHDAVEILVPVIYQMHATGMDVAINRDRFTLSALYDHQFEHVTEGIA